MAEIRPSRAVRRLGPFEVSSIGLGTARIAIEGRPSWDTGVEVIRGALDAGVTLIDTADAYCLDSTEEHGYGERLVAEGLRATAPRETIVATKGGELRGHGRWKLNGRPEHLQKACEASLHRLGVDVIDLYQLHRPDPAVPLAESLGAMVELRERGMVRELGVCNVRPKELELALSVAPIAAVQNPLSVGSPDQDSILDLCEKEGVTLLTHSPFGGPVGASLLESDPIMARIAHSYDVSPFEVALAALLARSPVVIPIPGTANPARPAQHARAMQLELGPIARSVWTTG